jgi:hypothetical protein
MTRLPLYAASVAGLFLSPLALAKEAPEGFVSIFPEASLAGWVGGSTIDPSTITPEQQATWDAELRDHWRVEGEELVSDGHGPHLVTTRNYRDFELLIDWKLSPSGDSGVYLRDTPQVQLWDPENKAAHENGAQKGSGALWNNNGRGKWPLKLADKPTGEWNAMTVRMVGPYVRVVLNGELVVDDAPLENYFDRTAPVFSEGRIHLQTHGSETRFRRLLVREIKPSEAASIVAEVDSRPSPG